MGTGDGSEGREGGGKGRTVGERRVAVHHPPRTVRPPPTHRFFDFSFQERGGGQGCREDENEERRSCPVFRFLLGVLDPLGVPDGRGGPWIVMPEIDGSVSAEALVEMRWRWGGGVWTRLIGWEGVKIKTMMFGQDVWVMLHDA